MILAIYHFIYISEDEFHFLMHCKLYDLYDNHRQKLFSNLSDIFY